MSNPYSPVTPQGAFPETSLRKVDVRPIDLLKRSYSLIQNQYWLFLGLVLVAILVGSAVPFGILFGPMLVGVFMCFRDRAHGRVAEFGTLFKGFDVFMESFVAYLLMTVASIVVMLPCAIAMIAFLVALASGTAPGQEPPLIVVPIAIVMVLIAMAFCMLAYIPFMFAFQLIADQQLGAVDAIKWSYRAVVTNLWGVLGLTAAYFAISLLLSLMCYIPLLFFSPILYGAMYVLYSDIFGRTLFEK